MPKSQRGIAGSRQRPVSCGFCRTRKLRCSRIAPCSNCIARGITCDLDVPQAPSNNGPSSTENLEIIDRLHRIEELLLTRKRDGQGQTDQCSSAARLQSYSASTFQNQGEDPDGDIAGLGTGSLNELPLATTPKNRLVFKTCSVAHITKAHSYMCISPCAPHYIANCEITRCIWLPPRAEAQRLLEKFLSITHHLPYITHTPSLPSMLEQVYADWVQNHSLQPGPIILVLSIFAAATYFWTQSDCVAGLFSDAPEANAQAPFWAEAAENVLNVVCRSTQVSIEGVQGVIIAGFIRAHLGELHSYRLQSTTAMKLARDQGLHRIDHPSHVASANTAQAEIGRRIWWYLCASDWAMAARVGGIAAGTYSCHPRQMITNKPLNINEEDIFDNMKCDGRPLSQPTTMSYTMQRIRLAEVTRAIVDRDPLVMAHNGGLSHDAIMNIDTELQALINEVPAFFSSSESALVENHGLDHVQAQVIAFQGETIRFLLHLQRCKLHIPYLAHISEDPAYYLSREICIKSARLLIQSELWQEKSTVESELRFKFSDLLIGVFSACAVLLMDLCINPSSPQSENQREEVSKSFQFLGAAKTDSGSTAKLVNSLVNTLRKHNTVPLSPVSNYQEQQLDPGGGGERAPAMTSDEMIFDASDVPGLEGGREVAFPNDPQGLSNIRDDLYLVMDTDGAHNEDEDDLSSYWRNLTQDFEQGIDLGIFDWDGIFSELDSSFM